MNDNLSTNNRKLQLAKHILEKQWLTIHLRTDVPEPALQIPKHLRRAPSIALQYGYNMPVKIPDLAVLSEGIFGTLSFGGVQFFCAVPWSAVFAVSGEDGRGEAWVEDAPKMIADVTKRLEAAKKRGLTLVKGSVTRTTPARGVLRLV